MARTPDKMICFEFSLNGKHVSTAGIPAHAVLSSTVTWAGDGKKRRDLWTHLSGLDANVEPGYHLYWVERKLKVGDTVAVRIVKASRSDPARSRRRAWTPVELQQMAAKSYRSAIARYKKQRAGLDAEIARLGGLLKAGGSKKSAPG